MIVYWHKRDYRLLDNPALCYSLDVSKELNVPFLPIMGLETDLIVSLKTSYEFSQFQQVGHLSAMLPLFQNYQYYGINPALFSESVLSILSKIQEIHRIKILVSHQEHGTEGTFERDKIVQVFCNVHNIKWHQIPPSGVVRNLLSRDIRDSLVKQYINNDILPMPSFIEVKQPSLSLQSDAVKVFEDLLKHKYQLSNHCYLQESSEKQGLMTLESFCLERAKNYRGGISSPNRAMVSGSRLSQYLAYGSLSLRYIHKYFWNKIKSNNDSKLTAGMLGAMQRLHWREHFIQRLETMPEMPTNSINPDFDNIQYSHSLELFESFKTGNSGEVLIDACIRCLNSTGFINFRMRAMLVSYAVFGLEQVFFWIMNLEFIGAKFKCNLVLQE
jgi:deoxyribodipyrimidine photo-lyase